MTTPAVRALAKRYPQAEIDFLTQRPSNQFYEHSPYVHRVITARWRWRELLALLLFVRRRRYDLVIDFSGGSKTAHFAWLSGIRRRIGLADSSAAWCFTEPVGIADEVDYMAARKLEMLRGLDIDTTDASLDFFVAADAGAKFAARSAGWNLDRGPLYAVSPVSKHPYKTWPAERFAALCDRLIERRGGQVFFLIGPGEAHFAERVGERMRHPSLPIVDDLSLHEVAVLVDRAVCYIGNDNGLMHLSVARKRPTFAIFGRHSPRRWAAPTALHETIEYDPGCKSRCYYPGCKLECLTGISVDAAWRRLDGFLARAEAPA